MKRRLIAGLVLSALLLSSCTGTPIQHTVDLNARGAELAQTLCNQYGALSARFSLFQDGVEIASGGAAQGGVPVGNALYLIGSVGKTYVAAAAMRTEKEEKEGFLHRRVAEMMDGFSMEDERYASITPAMLLEHSAGFLGVGSKDRYLLDRAPVWRRAAEQLLKDLSEQRLRWNPGENASYDNDGYALLEICLTRLLADNPQEMLRETVFSHYGLPNPFDGFAEERVAATALTGKTGTILYPTFLSDGFYETASDLCAFGACYGADLAETAEKQDKKGTKTIPYAPGFDGTSLAPFSEHGITALYKDGDAGDYHTSMILLPMEGLSAVFVTSGGQSGLNRLAATELLLDALVNKQTLKERPGPMALPASEEGEMPPELSSASGLYGMSGGQFSLFVSDDGTMTMAGKDGGSVYTYRVDGSFMAEGKDEKLRLLDEDGVFRLWREAIVEVGGLGKQYRSGYVAEKLPENPLDEETRAAWSGRNGKVYALVSDLPSSLVYADGLPALTVAFDPAEDGYVYGAAVRGKDLLQTETALPGFAGRDAVDCRFAPAEDGERVYAGGRTYRDLSAVPALQVAPDGVQVKTSRAGGLWYRLPGGEKVRLEIDAGAVVALYDADGGLFYHSILDDKRIVTLPAGGFALFLGEDGQEIGLSLING